MSSLSTSRRGTLVVMDSIHSIAVTTLNGWMNGAMTFIWLEQCLSLSARTRASRSLMIWQIVIYQIFSLTKSTSMKSRVIELQEKANQLLELAQAMDASVESAKRFKNQFEGNWEELAERWEHRQHIRESKSRKLWSAYLQVLTQIKLEL